MTNNPADQTLAISIIAQPVIQLVTAEALGFIAVSAPIIKPVPVFAAFAAAWKDTKYFATARLRRKSSP